VERKEAIQKEQAEVKSWAQLQGIDPTYLMPGFGRHKRGWSKPA